MGVYKLDRTLHIPAGSDVQLVGDGASEIATVLQWTGRTGEPLFLFEGPTQASIQDMNIAAGSGTGVLVKQCNQLDGKVFADQLNVGVHVGQC